MREKAPTCMAQGAPTVLITGFFGGGRGKPPEAGPEVGEEVTEAIRVLAISEKAPSRRLAISRSRRSGDRAPNTTANSLRPRRLADAARLNLEARI